VALQRLPGRALEASGGAAGYAVLWTEDNWERLLRDTPAASGVRRPAPDDEPTEQQQLGGANIAPLAAPAPRAAQRFRTAANPPGVDAAAAAAAAAMVALPGGAGAAGGDLGPPVVLTPEEFQDGGVTATQNITLVGKCKGISGYHASRERKPKGTIYLTGKNGGRVSTKGFAITPANRAKCQWGNVLELTGLQRANDFHDQGRFEALFSDSAAANRPTGTITVLADDGAHPVVEAYLYLWDEIERLVVPLPFRFSMRVKITGLGLAERKTVWRKNLTTVDPNGRTETITVWEEYASGAHAIWKKGATYIFEHLELSTRTVGVNSLKQYNAWFDAVITEVPPTDPLFIQ